MGRVDETLLKCQQGMMLELLLKLQNPSAGGLNPAVVVVYCFCDSETELLIKGLGLIIGRLHMKVDGLYLDGLLDELGFGLLAILILFGFGSGGILVDDLDLFAWTDVVEDVLQQC